MIFFTKSKAGGGGVRLSKNPRGETNLKLKPRQAILTKTIHKTRRQAGGFVLFEALGKAYWLRRCETEGERGDGRCAFELDIWHTAAAGFTFA